MTDKIHLFIAGLILSAFLNLSGCSNSYHDEIDRGAGYNFRPGYPELRLAATGFVDEFDDSYIVVAGDIVYESLVYSGKNEVYEANLNIEIQILETENNNVVVRENYSETITDENQLS